MNLCEFNFDDRQGALLQGKTLTKYREDMSLSMIPQATETLTREKIRSFYRHCDKIVAQCVRGEPL